MYDHSIYAYAGPMMSNSVYLTFLLCCGMSTTVLHIYAVQSIILAPMCTECKSTHYEYTQMGNIVVKAMD